MVLSDYTQVKKNQKVLEQAQKAARSKPMFLHDVDAYAANECTTINFTNKCPNLAEGEQVFDSVVHDEI